MKLSWILIVALVPLVLLGLFVLAVELHGLVRYDEAYFTETYAARYDTPFSTARALEGALQEDDQALLAELQGLRQPAAFKTGPSLILVRSWERTDRYFAYMYLDLQNSRRRIHYVEQVKGRWVVAPTDAHYYLHSGRWVGIFLPLAIVWWLLGTAAMLVVLVFRLPARLHAQMLGDQEADKRDS